MESQGEKYQTLNKVRETLVLTASWLGENIRKILTWLEKFNEMTLWQLSLLSNLKHISYFLCINHTVKCIKEHTKHF